MLWTIFVILLIMWALGLVTSYTMGGFIHILLVIALIVLVINLVQGRRSFRRHFGVTKREEIVCASIR